jgi:tetratricopeptide (TPR) repeat protein
MPPEKDSHASRSPRLLRLSQSSGWIGAGLLCAATLWAQADQASEKLRQAREFVIAGKPEQAIPIYQELVRAAPNSPELLMDLCIAEFKAKRYRDAIDHAQAALRLQPDLPSANLFLGASYVELGESAAAIPPLNQVLGAQPNERNARLMLAQALSGAKRYEEAAQQFRKLSELIPDNPKVWYGLGQTYDRLSQRTPAEREQFRVLAGQAYDRLMRLPRSSEAYAHAAELRAEGGEWAEAARQWREALKLAPDDGRVRTGLVWALYRSRDYEAALALIDGTRKGDPDSAELNFLSGACWLNLEEPQKSIPYLEKAIDADSHLLPAQAALGQALLQTGRAKDAIPHLKAALSIDEDGSGHYQLFRAYEIAGQGEAARQALSDYEEFTKRLRLANP